MTPSSRPFAAACPPTTSRVCGSFLLLARKMQASSVPLHWCWPTTSRFQRAAIYQPEATHNSYTSELEGNSQELFFSNEKSLVNWLRTRPDLINTQVQSSSTAYFSQVCYILFSYKLLFYYRF